MQHPHPLRQEEPLKTRSKCRGSGLVQSFFEQWGSAIGDILVAIGVAIEIKFGRMAGIRQSEMRRRSDALVGIANQRAEEARERTAKLEQFTAWRRISPEGEAIIVQDLKLIAPTLDIFIEYHNGDPEAFSLANDISRSFTNAGVVTPISGGPNMLLNSNFFGVLIDATPPVDITNIELALRKAGVDCRSKLHDPLSLPKKQPPQNLYIYVAPKPALQLT